MNQVLDTPPGELPPFIAYKLNGGPFPLERGGPVRLVVPWAHGFKSIKWLQKIVLTNRYDNNDTYAEQNNDPESYLKTAAYFDDLKPENFAAGKRMVVRGHRDGRMAGARTGRVLVAAGRRDGRQARRRRPGVDESNLEAGDAGPVTSGMGR